MLCLLGGALLLCAAGAHRAGAQQAGSPAEAPLPRLVDATAESGVEFRHRYGSLEKYWATEFGGSGGGWIDFDVDGRIDLILVNALDDFGYFEEEAGAAPAVLPRSKKTPVV